MLPVVLFEETSPHDPMLTNSFDRLREGDALSVFVMFSTPDADELLTHARAHPEATLYILDIDLPQTRDGIALWREISSLNPSAYGVFTSAHSHFALACLRAHAFDFLVKPFTYEDLKSTVRPGLRVGVILRLRVPKLGIFAAGLRQQRFMRAVLDDLSVRRARLPMSIPLGDHTLQVDQNDVVSLHTHGNLVCCRLTDGEYSWRESLSAVLERLEQRLFVRVSRSCAVNVRHIQTMDWGESLLTMDDGRIHPVSRRMKSALRAAISS